MEPVNMWRPWRIAGGVILFGLVTEAAYSAYRRFRRLDRSNNPSKVLFFPDKRSLCRSMYTESQGCCVTNCKYSHDESSSFGQLIKHLMSARKSLDISVFCMTNAELAEGVILLHRRGILVRIITDYEQVDAKNSQVGKFYENGIAVRRNTSYFMHHKFAVVDKKILMGGSLNWTRQGVLGNNENVQIIWDAPIIQAFLEEFERLWTEFDPTKQCDYSNSV